MFTFINDNVAIGILLGLLQGITEWLPVSSEGVTTSVNSFFFSRDIDEAVTYALWLHLGTVVSVLIVLRRECGQVIRGVLVNPHNPSNLTKYLFISTLVSGLIGFPLLLSLGELSVRLGAAAMGIVGLMMFVTGWFQLRGGGIGTRGRDDISTGDAIVAGIAQGFAALPGLSRSGLTVAMLLSRQVDRREALVLSFLMSIPASLGAGLYASIDNGLLTSGNALLAAGVAAVIGLVTIKALLSVAERVNFAIFILVAGALVLGGAVWQGLG